MFISVGGPDTRERANGDGPWIRGVDLLKSGVETGLVHGQSEHAGNDRDVIGLNPRPHPIPQELEIRTVDGMAVRRKEHRLALVRFKSQRVRLRDSFRRWNDQCRKHTSRSLSLPAPRVGVSTAAGTRREGGLRMRGHLNFCSLRVDSLAFGPTQGSLNRRARERAGPRASATRNGSLEFEKYRRLELRAPVSFRRCRPSKRDRRHFFFIFSLSWSILCFASV